MPPDVATALAATSVGGHPDVPAAIDPLPATMLLSRSTVAKFLTEWQPLGKTAYVNSDTSFREGVAGVAYESGAIGRRVEIVQCVNINAGEYLALLMAMGDADAVGLTSPVIFRVDAEAIAKRKVGKTRELIEPRNRIRALLARNPQWQIRHIPREKNTLADALASRPFLPIDKSEWTALPNPRRDR
jgi:Reverse transcriptase-like